MKAFFANPCMSSWQPISIKLILAWLLLLLGSTSFAQSTYTVNMTTDDGNTSTMGTLSWAINQVNTNSGGRISFSVSNVTLTAVLPSITQSCTIIGRTSLVPATASGGTIIVRSAGATNFRIFKAVTAGTTLVLQNLILQNGVAAEGDNNQGGGGLLANLGAGGLTMSRCLVRNCSTIGARDGGGLQLVSGSAIITDCQFASNTAISDTYGGGIVIGQTGQANSSQVTLERCTFTDNSAAFGGGLYHRGPASLINCTFSGNSASFGVGNAISQGTGNLNLIHCSFIENYGNSRTLVLNAFTQLVNCLFSGNTNSGNGTGNFYNGIISSLGGNVSDVADGTYLNQPSDKNSQTLPVGPLQRNNGGLVSTHNFISCSPAKDAGVTSATVTLPTTDANNQPRTSPPDAGAVEFQGMPLTVTNPATTSAILAVSFSQNFTAIGGTMPMSYSLTSGTLPTELSFASTGVLSGTPTQSGSFPITIRVTDANGCSAVSNTYALVVYPSLVITALSPTRNQLSAPISTSISFTFDQPISTGAATLGALRVFSQQRGGQLRNGAGGVTTASGNTLSFTPTSSFKPGETIFSTVTSQVQGTSGLTLVRGHVFQFTTQVGGTGRGNLLALPTTSVGDRPQDIRLGDLNNDGNLDFVTVNENSNTVSVRLGTGTGAFTTPASGAELTAPSGPLGVSIGDIDNDGDLDILAGGSTMVNVYRNHGDASFDAPVSITIGAFASSLAMGDVDGDGDLDFVVANTDNLATGTTASLLINDGMGQFASPAAGGTIPLGNGPMWVALHDMDGDGDLDLLGSNAHSNTLSVRLNDGNGQFSPPSTNSEVAIPTFFSGPNVFTVGDIDSDGDLDVVVGATFNLVYVLLNDGSGQLTYVGTVDMGGSSQSVALGDMDSDGDLDLVSATGSVRLNNGLGNFTAPIVNTNPGVGGLVVMLGDVDNDGDLDAVTNNLESNNVSTLLNGPAPLAVVNFAATPNTVCPNSPITFTATVGNLTGSYTYTLTNEGTAIPDTTITGTASSPTFSLTLAVNGFIFQTFTLKVNNNDQSASASTNVSFYKGSVAILSDNGPLSCSATSVTLTASASGGRSYTFANENGILGTPGESNTLVVSSAGTYSVTIANSLGCLSTATTTVTSTTNAASVSLNASSLTITCANPLLSLSAIGEGSIRWSTGSSSSVISVSLADTYSVTLTNSSGCTATNTITISSNTLTPSLSTMPPSATLTCTSPVVSLSAIGNGSVRWSTEATTPVITVNTAGTYSVTLTGANGCTATSSATVVSGTVAASVGIDPPNGTLSCATPAVSLSAIGNGTVRWSTGASTSVISATTAGIYSVILTNSNGCTATASATISGTVLRTATVTTDGSIGCGRTSAQITIQAVGATSFTLLGSSGFSAVNGSGVFSVTAGGSYTGLAGQSDGCVLSGEVTVDSGGIPPSASDFRASGPLGAGSCSVRLLATATGNTFVMTGPGGYVFSSTYRTGGTYAITGLDVRLPGTYTLTVYSGSCVATYTTVVTGTACSSGQ